MSVNLVIAKNVIINIADLFEYTFKEDHCFETEAHRRAREQGSLIKHGFTNNFNEEQHICTITHGAKMGDHPKLAYVSKDIALRMIEMLLQDAATLKHSFLALSSNVEVSKFTKALLIAATGRYHDKFDYFAGIRSCPETYNDILSIILLLKDAEKSERLSIQIDISSKLFKVIDPNDLFISPGVK